MYRVSLFLTTTLLGSMLLTTACVPESPPSLSRAMLKEVDSIYRSKVPSLRKELDSICVLKTEEVLSQAVDSIIQRRLEERKKKLGY